MLCFDNVVSHVPYDGIPDVILSNVNVQVIVKCLPLEGLVALSTTRLDSKNLEYVASWEMSLSRVVSTYVM